MLQSQFEVFFCFNLINRRLRIDVGSHSWFEFCLIQQKEDAFWIFYVSDYFGSVKLSKIGANIFENVPHSKKIYFKMHRNRNKDSNKDWNEVIQMHLHSDDYGGTATATDDSYDDI